MRRPCSVQPLECAAHEPSPALQGLLLEVRQQLEQLTGNFSPKENAALLVFQFVSAVGHHGVQLFRQLSFEVVGPADACDGQHQVLEFLTSQDTHAHVIVLFVQAFEARELGGIDAVAGGFLCAVGRLQVDAGFQRGRRPGSWR